MELQVYELMNILAKIDNQHLIVKFKADNQPDCDIYNVSIVGFLDKEPIVRIEI
jgi:hypothetical protein